jgi:hypothetical protein
MRPTLIYCRLAIKNAIFTIYTIYMVAATYMRRNYMNSKLAIFTLLLLLTSVNSMFCSIQTGKIIVVDYTNDTDRVQNSYAGAAAAVNGQKVAPPNWFHAGYLKRELAIFNSLEPNLQILVRGLLGTQVMQRKGGLKMFYPDDKRVYDLVINYLNVVGDEVVNNKIPLLGKSLMDYAIAQNNQPLINELKKRLATVELKKHLAYEELQKRLATQELKKRLIPQELETVPADEELKRRQALEELEKHMANEIQASKNAIPQL